MFLVLSYYLQQTRGYSPLVTGVASLPFVAGTALASNLSTIVVMPRVGPRPVVASGMLAEAGAMAWLAQLGPHTGYAVGVLGPLILAGVGFGQELGASIGTSLLNTIFAGAVTSYLAAHLAAARLTGRQGLAGLALAHGYNTAFWWGAGILAGGAVIGGALFRPGPLARTGAPSAARADGPAAPAETAPPGRHDPRGS
jgi:hypothetical protein